MSTNQPINQSSICLF